MLLTVSKLQYLDKSDTIIVFLQVTGADPGYVKRGGRDPKGGAGWLI